MLLHRCRGTRRQVGLRCASERARYNARTTPITTTRAPSIVRAAHRVADARTVSNSKARDERARINHAFTITPRCGHSEPRHGTRQVSEMEEGRMAGVSGMDARRMRTTGQQYVTEIAAARNDRPHPSKCQNACHGPS